MRDRHTYYSPESGGSSTRTKGAYLVSPQARHLALQYILHHAEDAVGVIKALGLDQDVTVEYRVMHIDSSVGGAFGTEREPWIAYEGEDLSDARDTLKEVRWDYENRNLAYKNNDAEEFTWDAWIDFREVTPWQRVKLYDKGQAGDKGQDTKDKTG